MEPVVQVDPELLVDLNNNYIHSQEEEGCSRSPKSPKVYSQFKALKLCTRALYSVSSPCLVHPTTTEPESSPRRLQGAESGVWSDS